VIATAAAVLTLASVVELAVSVAPDASSASQVTVTRAERTTAGPLVLPTVGVVAPAIESLYPTPSAAPQHTAAVSRGTRTSQTAPEAVSGALVAMVTPSVQTVTQPPQPVSEDQPAELTPTTPLADPIAAAESATPTSEEPAVTPEPTESPVTVDVTAEVTP
jgi:hypothetical protein